MNEKTNEKKTFLSPEFSNKFVYFLVITACATLLVVFSSRIIWRDIFLKDFLTRPDVRAAQIITSYAISEFQGNPIMDVSLKSSLHMLFTIVLNFVLAPIGLFLCWRSIVIEYSQPQGMETKRKYLWMRRIIMAGSGMILTLVLIIYIAAAFLGASIFRTLQYENAVDRNRAYVVYELNDVGAKAVQYYLLPVQAGGGGLSFHSQGEAGREGWVTLKELGVPKATSAGSYSFRKVENDTIAFLRGIGNVRLSDGTYPEYEIRITPLSLGRSITRMN